MLVSVVAAQSEGLIAIRSETEPDVSQRQMSTEWACGRRYPTPLCQESPYATVLALLTIAAPLLLGSQSNADSGSVS